MIHTIDLAELRDSVLTELETLSGDEAGLLETLQDFRDSFAVELLLQNDGLEGSAPYQSNEKWVNELLLNTIVQNMYAFSEGQIDTLEALAIACPLSDGEAVLKARALLALIDGNLEVYDDSQLCDPGEERSMPVAQNQALRVYPNPADNEVVVEFDRKTSLGKYLLLFNVYGQSIRVIQLTSQDGKVAVGINDLPAGIYWYAVPGLKSGVASGKIIIQH